MPIPLTGLMIESFGWRNAFLALAAIILFVVIPATAIFQRRSPEEVGQFPDGINAAPIGSPPLPFENPGFGLYLLVMTLLGTFGVGFAFAALTLTIREAAQNAVNFLQFGLLILCANFFPFAALPPALLAVSRVIPLAYAVDAFRSTMMGFPPGFPELASIQTETVIVTLFGIFMPLLGYGLYRRAEKRARGQGTLSKY